MPWKERNIQAWGAGEELQEGDEVEGKLVRTEPNVNATEKVKLFDYLLDPVTGATLAGEPLTVTGELRIWGSRLLNLQLTEKDTGRNVKIAFDGFGKAHKGKNAPKQFKVQVEE